MAHLTGFSRQGLHFDVSDEGPEQGPVVILLHGFPQDATAWDAVRPALHARGLRTLAPDQRGYSRHARPREVSDYSGAELVADVLALADAAGARRFHLVGHDWGGAIAWQTALAAPDRLASLTVLSTPHPVALSRALRTPQQVRRSWYIGTFQVPALPERVLAGRVAALLRHTGVPASAAERYGRRFTTADDLRGPIGWYRAAARSGRLWTTSDPQPVGVPTTFVWGRRDMALGRTAAELTGEHVTAPYRFVELDALHWLPELEPDAVATAIVQQVESVS